MPPCHAPNSICNSIAVRMIQFTSIFLKLLNYYLKTIEVHGIVSELSRTAFGW